MNRRPKHDDELSNGRAISDDAEDSVKTSSVDTDDGMSEDDQGNEYAVDTFDEAADTLLLARVAARTKGGGRVMINCPAVRLARSVGSLLILDFAEDGLRAQVEFDTDDEANEVVEALATTLAGPIDWSEEKAVTDAEDPTGKPN